jgi:hypothetical protein
MDTDQDLEDLYATIIDVMAAYLEDSPTTVYESAECGSPMIKLANGRTFRVALIETSP